MSGIRYLSNRRRGFSGYYRWVTEHEPQELFFAGRSVLHRIDADIRLSDGGSAEAALLRCLQQKSKIKILLLDPRTNILERLAHEENQTLKAMLCDIVTSLGICRRLFDLLQSSFTHLEPSAELTVRVYDRVPYFAYHKQNDEVIIGFYFQSTKGSSSAAYDIVDPPNKAFFGDHFDRIFSDAAKATLVEFDGARGRPRFDRDLFKELIASVETHLSTQRIEELLSPPQASSANKVD